VVTYYQLQVCKVSLDRKKDSIFQAKLAGKSDDEIMREFSVGLKDIEQAVISKTGVNLNLFKSKPKITHLSPKNFELETSTVWSFKQRGKWATHNGNYRGNWSPYIPRNIILRYSSPGDIVLDPFCGGGTTAVEAKLLGRRCIARDINPGAVILAKRNLSFSTAVQTSLDEDEVTVTLFDPDVAVGDARNLSTIDDESIDLICTHPPYADIVNYSENIDGDLSLLNVEAFIQEMSEVASEFKRVLKPDGNCVILIGDMRKNKRVIPLGFKTIEQFRNVGFSLKDLIIKRQHNCRTTGFWYTSSIKHNFLLLSQEYLPVFTKQCPDNDMNQPKLGDVHPFVSSREKPAKPETIQCKTTWVLPRESWEYELESNLLNRYGGNGRIIEIELKEDRGKLPVDQLDLVYLHSTNPKQQCIKDIAQFKIALQKMIPEIHERLSDEGHLAIRVKDFRDQNQLCSPSLESWKIPLEYFKIREIIVATSYEDDEQGPQEQLQVDHEIILVY